MTEQEKNKLAELNGFSKERRTDKIREGVKKIYRLEDEVAILRKMNKRLFDLVIELHGKEIADEVTTEFKQYYEDVERIKEEVDGT
jgi:hypothetical protein